MQPEMSEFAVVESFKAIERFGATSEYGDMAHKISSEFDNKYGKAWNCSCLTDEGGYSLICEPHCFISLVINDITIVIFKHYRKYPS